MTTIDLLEQRINKLQRNARIYRISFFSFIVVIALVAFVGFRGKGGAADVVKAKEFQVVDDYGKVYMSLRHDELSGLMDLYGNTGTKLLTFTSSDGGAGTIIGRDAAGTRIYRFINVKGGGGSLQVYNTDEKIADELTITDKNTGFLQVSSPTGDKMHVLTYGSSSSSGIFSVYNSTGTRICVLGSDASSNGVLNVCNSSGGAMNGVWPK